ncbi:hypothetical protein SY88_12125 [Clostridiales bacterium PH28_bin88]|nr:hypothetical protein SY88_12125 [Clostridiales bacterium PH28_bin88]
MSKRFGPLLAVNNVSITIEKGKVSGIIGPNGSGKTTLFNLLSGFFPPTEGKIFFEGQDITQLKPQERVNLGIGRSFQLVSIFPRLKVYENLVLAVLRFRESLKKGVPFYLARVTDKTEILDDCQRYLEMVGLDKKRNMYAGEMSYGDQRLLEIILSISLKPKILLLDEPFSGLGDVEIAFILELLHKVKDDFTIVIIEHKISKIENFVEHLVVLSQGVAICQGKPSEVFCDAEVRRCYWGEVV